MKRVPLTRRTALRRSTAPIPRHAASTPRRAAKPAVRAPGPLSGGPARDWSAARRKVAAEGRCRVDDATCAGPVQAAHTIGRRYDTAAGDGGPLVVHPDAVVPLCEHHHRAYDARRFDVLPYLTLDEQAHAVALVGIVRALGRLTGSITP